LIDLNQKYVDLLPQWKDVASILAVDELKMQWVEICVRPIEGLTRAMLEVYMSDGGTLGEVLQALYDLECFEILEKIKDATRAFLDRSKDQEENVRSDDGDFFSLLATLNKQLGKQDPCKMMQKFSENFCRVQAASSTLSHDLIVRGSDSQIGVTNDPNPGTKLTDLPVYKPGLQKQRWDERKSTSGICRILLIFADDGLDISNQIYDKYQGMEVNGRTVDFFRMTENSLWYEVLVNPEGCCQKWAGEADFVMPILTPNFLRDVQGGPSYERSQLLPTSPIINRFLYTVLRARYASSGSRNTLVRPVIPKKHIGLAANLAVRNEPLFRLVWVEFDNDLPEQKDALRKRLHTLLDSSA
jgi:hypothetical protein